MKAVLVLDEMPECCADGCIFYEDRVCDCCYAKDHEPIDDIDERPDWCPLRPMPEYREYYHEYGQAKDFADGWNACLDAMGGDD